MQNQFENAIWVLTAFWPLWAVKTAWLKPGFNPAVINTYNNFMILSTQINNRWNSTANLDYSTFPIGKRQRKEKNFVIKFLSFFFSFFFFPV